YPCINAVQRPARAARITEQLLMRKTATTPPGTRARPAPKRTRSPASKIHPVVIYPFRQPSDYSDLQALYQLVRRLAKDKDRYARPITVLDRKTHYSMAGNKAYL